MSLSHGLSAASASSGPLAFVGRTVLCTDGQEIGTVKDVYDDSSSGVVFASVSTGLLSGRAFVPLGQVSWQGEDLVVPFSKDFVKGSPSLGAGVELSPAEEAQVFEYYGLSSPGPSDFAGTERVVSGTARLRKRVVSEEVSGNVPAPSSGRDVSVGTSGSFSGSGSAHR